LTSIAVVDDNGTPGNTADDFSPTSKTGDTNSNNQIDVGETWTYTMNRTVVAGEVEHEGTVTAVGNAQSISDSDLAIVLGAVPGIQIQVDVNENDADTGPGPSIAAGDAATFTYLLFNTGNVALQSISVTDNNGTPGNAADDFHPTLTEGDVNQNAKLDTGEVWIYKFTRTAGIGEYANNVSVTAIDVINQIASSLDATNYLGVVNADFDKDTTVTAADYVMWRMNSTTSSGATRSEGDADGNGAVNEDDYFVWRSQFDTAPAGASALTEVPTGADVHDAEFVEELPVAAPVAADFSESAASPVDAAFRQIGVASTVQATRTSRDAVNVQLTTSGSDWHSLLAILAEGNSHRRSATADTESSSDSQSDQLTSADNSCTLGKDVAQKLIVRNASK
jgi:hypothetical protein